MGGLWDNMIQLIKAGIYTVAELTAMLRDDHEEESGPWVSEADGTYHRESELDIRIVNRAGGEINQGDLVTVDEAGNIRRVGDTPIGIAMGNGMVRLGFETSFTMASYYYAGSQAVWPPNEATRMPHETVHSHYQYTQRQDAEKKAWLLLEKYMTSEQYFAFMEGTTVELINKAETHRILVNRKGDFTILTGIKAGTGVTESEGRIHSYKYPLGDEISAFLDWFRHRTPELIANWNCGTYGIVKEGERR